MKYLCIVKRLRDMDGLNKTGKGTEAVPNRFLSIIKLAFLYSLTVVMDSIIFPIALIKILWEYKKESKNEKKLETTIIS